MDNKLRYSDDLRRRGRRLALPSSFGICHAGRYEFVAEIANAFLRGPDYPDIQATLLRLVAGQIAVQAVIPNFGTASSSLTLTIRRIVCFRYRIELESVFWLLRTMRLPPAYVRPLATQIQPNRNDSSKIAGKWFAQHHRALRTMQSLGRYNSA
jgi:hypothetical protein